ncbi:MAG: hypothetical protein WAR79_17990 [Melioribacteraceae bacterium]
MYGIRNETVNSTSFFYIFTSKLKQLNHHIKNKFLILISLFGFLVCGEPVVPDGLFLFKKHLAICSFCNGSIEKMVLKVVRKLVQKVLNFAILTKVLNFPQNKKALILLY